jgi:ubiquinone/menaquinone biosynthesis C-methylase UbiE
LNKHPKNVVQEWWESGFEAEWGKVYAYKRQDTRMEVEGIIQMLGLPELSSVLDVGCGEGRIAIPLAKRGYRLTGLEFSGDLLKSAAKKAARAGIEIKWIKGDMRRIGMRNRFDSAISIFTSLGYFSDQEGDLQTLISIRQALKKSGKLVLDLENPAQVLNLIKEQVGQPVLSVLDRRGAQVESLTTYDKQTKRVTVSLKLKPGKDLEARQIKASYRLYNLAEITGLMEDAGLYIQAVFGDFNLNGFSYNSERMVILATKNQKIGLDPREAGKV